MGKTGSGNSASGKTILRKDAFREEAYPVAIPKHCEIQNGISANDTPGVTEKLVSGRLYDTLDKIQGVHLFLLVIPRGRFTEEERNIVRWTQTNLGEEGLKSSIVLFTGEDQLEGKTVEAFLRESPDLQCLVGSCAGGYQREIEEAKLVIREEERRRWGEREREIRAEEEERCKREKKKVREMEKKRRKMRVRDLKDEEDWKRGNMERRIRREERKKGDFVSEVWPSIRKLFSKS